MVTVEELDARLTRVERKVEDWDMAGTATLTELREAQRTNAKMFSVLNENISGLKAEMDRRFATLTDEVNSRFAAVDARFEAVDARFETVNDGIQTIIGLLKDDDDNGERN